MDRTEIDQTVKQFIEILTSDYAVMTYVSLLKIFVNPSFHLFRLFRHNYDPFTGGKLYRSDPVGHSKGQNRFAENVKFVSFFNFSSFEIFLDRFFIVQGQERRPGMFKGFALVDREGSTFAALNIDGILCQFMVKNIRNPYFLYWNSFIFSDDGNILA